MKAWLVFLDESGMLLGPLVRRSGGPRGHTPVLYQRGRHHKKLSVIAGLCLSPARDPGRFYFRLYPNADIQAPHVIRFLHYPDRELQGPGLLIGDRLNAHRAKITAQWIATRHTLRTVFLPAYAPH